MHVLVIEDDITTVAHLVNGLATAKHTANWAYNAQDGLIIAQSGAFDAFIIDRMLAETDGISIVAALRAAKIDTPILVLTTMGGIDDRINGLNAGADDYLIKPFALGELLARLNALGRRYKSPVDTTLTVGDLVLDRLQRTVSRAGKEIMLQQREYEILQVLMQNAGDIVTRKMLLETVWNYDFDPRTNIVESHLSRLRTKVDKGFDRELITTIRGAGYRLDA